MAIQCNVIVQTGRDEETQRVVTVTGLQPAHDAMDIAARALAQSGATRCMHIGPLEYVEDEAGAEEDARAPGRKPRA